jgi:anti-sigma factor ChrR (cupin superfamily)
MSVTSMVPRVSSRHKYHLDSDEMEIGAGWQFRPGISIRELFTDRDGYRVTYMRYADGAMEPERMQGEDEHIFVLNGILRDASADYAPGSYLLNPAGLRPKLWSPGGCSVIIHRIPSNQNGLKFEAISQSESRSLLEAQSGEAFPHGSGWEELRPGVFMLPLFEGAPGNYKSALQRFLPGASLPEHIHMGDEHTFILEGCQEDEMGSYDMGAYVFNPIGTSHQVWTEEGCLALVHWRAPARYLEDVNRQYY